MAEPAGSDEDARLDRLVHDLYRRVAPRLSLISFQLANIEGRLEPWAARRIEECVAEIDDLMKDVRVLLGVRADDQVPVDALDVYLRSLAAQVERRDGVAPALTVSGSLEHLPRPIARQLAAVAAEGLGEAVRYGHISRIAVELRIDESEALLAVTHDGVRAPDEPLDGFAMTVIAERARRLGGSFTLDLQPPDGTTFAVRVPLTIPRVGRAVEKDGDGSGSAHRLAPSS